MMRPLPLNEPEIFVTWMTDEGGIRVTARTDATGQSFLGLTLLGRAGLEATARMEFLRRRLIDDIIIGYYSRTPIVVRVDIEIHEQGLDLVVEMPINATERYRCRRKALWGGFHIVNYMEGPSNSNWPHATVPSSISH